MRRDPTLLHAACLIAAVACREPSTASTPSPGDDHANAASAAQLAAAAHPPAHAGPVHGAAHAPHCEHHDHAAHVVPAQAPLASESIYHATARLRDQRGQPLELASLRGSVVLATMFYASCTSVCPMLISQLSHVDRALSPEARAQTQILAISLDPARDTSEKLRQLAARHGVEDERWHFVRTSEDSVRELAALLGVRYTVLPGGEISHSPIIALLDREGALVMRMENAGGDPAELIAALDRAVRVPMASASVHAR